MHVTDAPVLDPADGPFSAVAATQADHVKVLSRSLADQAMQQTQLGVRRPTWCIHMLARVLPCRVLCQEMPLDFESFPRADDT